LNLATLPRIAMSLSVAETLLRNAREQHSQQDINASLIKALGELTREVKRLDDEVRRARRDVQMARRF
jgi:phage host-nuclease inhibitor protein Gam